MVLVPVLAGAIALAWLVASRMPLLAIPFIAASSVLLAYALVQRDLVPAYMKVIAFLLPFSTPLPFLEGSMIRLPTEPMIGLALIMLPLFLLKERTSPHTPLLKEILYVIPLFGVYLFSTFFSEMLVVSLKFSLVNIAYVLVFYVLLLHLFRKHTRLFPDMLKLYGMGFLLVFLWSLYQYWQYDWNPVVLRGIFHPFFNDHTIFGAAAAILAVLAFKPVMRRNTMQGFLFGGVVGVFFVLAVFYSTSRGAMLSLLFAAFLALILWVKPRPLILGTGLVLLLITGYVFFPTLRDRIEQTEVLSYDEGAGVVDRTRSVVNISTDVSNVERLNRWVSAWRMFQERPLTGFGPGTYQFVYIPYQEERLMNRLTVKDPLDPPEGSGGTAHSEYLLLLSETGILGLMALLLVMGRWSWIALRRWRDHPRRNAMAIALVALSTYFFHALVNNFLTTDKMAFLFWGTAAWLVSMYYRADKAEVSWGVEGRELKGREEIRKMKNEK